MTRPQSIGICRRLNTLLPPERELPASTRDSALGLCLARRGGRRCGCRPVARPVPPTRQSELGHPDSAFDKQPGQ